MLKGCILTLFISGETWADSESKRVALCPDLISASANEEPNFPVEWLVRKRTSSSGSIVAPAVTRQCIMKVGLYLQLIESFNENKRGLCTFVFE